MEDSPGQDSKQRVTAIAEYDYFAKEDDEIDLLKGQIIQNITQKPGGWWEGTISSTGKRGMFPDNFVRVIENAENNMVVLREKSSSAQRRCKAIYSYTQVNEDELSLAVGDIIDFLTEVEEGWWRGKLNNKVGVFPSNFVVSIPTSPIFASQRPNFSEDSKATKSKAKKGSNTINREQTGSEENAISNKIIDTVLDKSVDEYRAPDLPPRPIKEFCRVEFPYSPQNDDELELTIGQIITIVDKELPDKGWWKGEVNGKIGVFPDNFVKLLPMDVALEKDIRTQQSKVVAKETSKKSINSIIPPLSPPKGFESRDSNEEFSNKTCIQTGNIAAQRMSLENISIELVTQSSSSDRTNRNSGLKTADTKKNIENFDEKKAPPPLPNKKPSIPVKKTITNVAGNMLSGLRQKVKNVEQKTSLSQDANDGGHSSKLNNDTRTNIERTSSVDEILDSEFDKVQRASILSDMRAGRVKAPKRRPPSVSTNLMTESIIKSMNLNNETDDVFDESETVSSTNNEELVKPKSIEYGAQKVPWMDELKASQIKIKSLPFIEPRTTLVNINNEIKIEEEKPIASVISNVSTKIINTESDVSLHKENVETKSSISYYQSSSSSEKNTKSEAEISKPTSDITINKESVKDKFEDIDEINPPKSIHSKINVMRMKSEKTKSTSSHVTIQSNETPDSATQEGKTIIELGKRVQKLETCVQMQQELIEDLRKMLQNESNRVELLKNQLDKYAQCVTQV